MNEFLKGKISIDKFIEHHNSNFINYCEVVIHPDGCIEYCIPSHQQTLIRLSGKSQSELSNEIDIMSDVLIELCNITGCISVWFNMYVNPNIVTDAQFYSLLQLRENKCICPELPLTKNPGYVR